VVGVVEITLFKLSACDTHFVERVVEKYAQTPPGFLQPYSEVPDRKAVQVFIISP
jgi:hypothetical protein